MTQSSEWILGKVREAPKSIIRFILSTWQTLISKESVTSFQVHMEYSQKLPYTRTMSGRKPQ